MTPVNNLKKLPWTRLWLIVGLFILVAVFEFSTPPEYVFGYLFIGPILLGNTQFGRVARLRLTFLACLITVLDAWIPDFYSVKTSTIANRVIVVFALLVTNFLRTRNRLYQEALLQQTTKLEAQEKLASVREDFASTLTHDLKTPLLGAIETLQAFVREDFGSVLAGQKKVLATMIRGHENSLQLVETLLDVYRNDIEGLKLHLEPVDLVAIAQEVAVTLTELASSRRVYISFNYGESEFRKFLWVNGDVFQLQRVFTNLLTNAINHSPRGGRIEVILESRFSEQIVKVIDSGSGISLEELPNIFERFYQGQSDRQAKGSGLGLYLSRQIIEAHGGKIWAENRTPNGAIFGFSLPALEFQLPKST